MFQMTDGAFAEARQFCLRNHVVVEDACWFSPLFSRVTPNHAIELTAVYLDRNVRAILAGSRNLKPNPANKHALAAVIHLCGPGAAKPYARRGFRPPAGERCGDHEIAGYLVRVRAIEREFRHLAANP